MVQSLQSLGAEWRTASREGSQSSPTRPSPPPRQSISSSVTLFLCSLAVIQSLFEASYHLPLSSRVCARILTHARPLDQSMLVENSSDGEHADDARAD